MADSYAQLLDALGFNAADAASQTGQVQRNLEWQQSQIRQQGVDQREALEANAESRGIISSGEYEKRKTRQRSDEAGAMSQAEVGAADRLQAIQRELTRSKAQSELAKREQALAAEQQAQQIALAEQQAQTQYQQYMELLSAAQQPSYGGLNWDAINSYATGYPSSSGGWGGGFVGSLFRRAGRG